MGGERTVEVSPDPLLLALFLVVSLLYSSVGLGGGSSYTALMAVFGMDYRMIPTISLTMNVAVTSMAVVNFWRRGHVDFRLILPFVISSVPMAYVGGAISVTRETFLWLLLVTLVFVVVRLYFWNGSSFRMRLTERQIRILSFLLGGVLGFVAGAVGIGGGIYLVPLMIVGGLASEKGAAATGACFVWINSLAGLLSRAQRGAFDAGVVLPLLGTVIVGGFVGSRLGAGVFKPRTVQKAVGAVVILAIIYLVKDLV
ncbi:MAG: sulfite exporter TauE/SafE family protein [Fidelibacterota bacterium]